MSRLMKVLIVVYILLWCYVIGRGMGAVLWFLAKTAGLQAGQQA